MQHLRFMPVAGRSPTALRSAPTASTKPSPRFAAILGLLRSVRQLVMRRPRWDLPAASLSGEERGLGHTRGISWPSCKIKATGKQLRSRRLTEYLGRGYTAGADSRNRPMESGDRRENGRTAGRAGGRTGGRAVGGYRSPRQLRFARPPVRPSASERQVVVFRVQCLGEVVEGLLALRGGRTCSDLARS